MSEKNRDEHGRWRNRTIGFRVSPEEDAEINALVALSGLTKQDYILRRLCNRDIVVVGNPRVYKALKTQMEKLYQEFFRLRSAEEIRPDTLRVFEFLAKIYREMNTNNTDKQGECGNV